MRAYKILTKKTFNIGDIIIEIVKYPHLIQC
jgi:hypothetical protein